jgi:3-phosphoshikimate 1-carboxyvinyltransferase
VSDVDGPVDRVLSLLESFGIVARKTARGLAVVAPARPLMGGTIASGADPDVAMAATVLALSADRPCTIEQAEGIVESFPRFVGSLRALGARIEVEP